MPMTTTDLLKRRLPLLLALLAGAPAQASALNGEAIYQHCANCHGKQGLGGDGGKHPRIAGLPQDYIERQLKAFKARKRINKPMLPIFKNWRFNEEAMQAVAAYISALPGDALSLPVYQPPADALAEFDSRAEFDAVGEEVFQDNCAQCHGDDGRGLTDKETPPLIRQYPRYLAKQIGDFIRGEREHEHAKKMFGELYVEEVEALLAYLDRLGRE